VAGIPQCDPRASYLTRRDALDAAVLGVLAAGRYVLGPEVSAFEGEFAEFTGVSHALGVANGTEALALALRAVGVVGGDVVISPSHTAVATTAAIRSIGATPLFVDVDETHGLLDPDHLERALTAIARGDLAVSMSQIRAVVPVHLYGRCADMRSILELTRKHGLRLVEDCAQAHGAQTEGVRAGAWGDAASFSFYPTKNLGAFGDGGAVVSDSATIIDHVRLLREYGWRTRYVSDIEGGNSRLDELQAAVLRVKLRHLDDDNARRSAIADQYRAGIRNSALRLPPPAPAGQHVYHQFAVRCGSREILRASLAKSGIGTLVHYPTSVHRQPAYANPEYAPLPLPNTERWAEEVISLPMFPQLSDEQIERVIQAVNEWNPSRR
jgi:dTDP-4-amino-4,6-dideoxygalactose transaminase